MARINYLSTTRPVAALDSTGNLLPSVDAVYGPYSSKSEAYSNLSATFGSNLTEGITVAVKHSGVVTEYWFQGGTGLDNLVLKHPSSWELYRDDGGDKTEQVFYETLFKVVDCSSFVKLQSNAPVELKVTLQAGESTTIATSNHE